MPKGPGIGGEEMSDHKPVELKEIESRRIGRGWLLFPALAFVAGVLVAMLLKDVLPTADVVAFVAPATPTPSAAVATSTAMPDPTPTPTATASPTPTPVPPTATPVPPTPTSTPTLTPTTTSTPLPPPTPPAPGPPTRPPMITREQWGSKEITEGYQPHTLERITIHHTGALFYGDAVATIRRLQSWSETARGWVDVPYHYLIDLEGNIYEGRPLQFVGDTATEYDPTGHALISVMGNYNIQEINQAQLGAIVDLASWLSYEYSIPPQLIRGHRDYAATACPGANLYRYLTSGHIVSAVEKRLQFENQ